ncbi:hypothetical protein J5N97_028752 [Dioscorea zingiberensis]|uniref:Uncharacterized protein n=1 Tax=Dioscorea zingiberensis TaxID=325984 RepID=A0A9D5H557_9LILI|nr:hypothetical protein J5N97_028752 [Dioscorea zingiberensis]
MGRAPCCDKANVKKGPWSPEEDSKLKEYIDKNGTGGNWIALPHKAGLKRCGKSCRLRWLNYLRPNIKHGEFSPEEDRIIFTLFATIGSRWSIIASQLPGRTDNDIKNYWNTKLKKKLLGIPPTQRKQNQQLFLPSLQATTSLLEETLQISPPDLLLLQPQAHNHHQYQMKDSVNSGVLMFGGHEPSCSSSDGSSTQISYGKELEFEFNAGDQNMSFGSYVYGDGSTWGVVGGGGGGVQPPLEVGSSNNGGNGLYWNESNSANRSSCLKNMYYY